MAIVSLGPFRVTVLGAIVTIRLFAVVIPYKVLRLVATMSICPLILIFRIETFPNLLGGSYIYRTSSRNFYKADLELGLDLYR